MKKTISLPLLACLLMAAGAQAAENSPPNIVLLIGDDHGAPYFGFMGDETVVTPNMDLIANSGLTFTLGHATASSHSSSAPVPQGLPGYSLKPLLDGNEMEERDAIVGYAHQRRSAEDMMGARAEGYYVRTRRWHFMWYKDSDEMALYDMTVDPKSENNVLDANRHLIQEFIQRIEAWKKRIGLTEPIAVS